MIKVVVAPLIMQGLSSCTYLALNPKCLESVMIINTSLHRLQHFSIFSQLADHLEAFGVITTVMAELRMLSDGLWQCHLWSPQMSIELDAFAGFYWGWTPERKSSIYSRKRIDGVLAALGRIQAEHFILFATLIAPFLALVFVLKRYILNFLDILSVSLWFLKLMVSFFLH